MSQLFHFQILLEFAANSFWLFLSLYICWRTQRQRLKWIKLATNLIAFRSVFRRCNILQQQLQQNIRITQPQEALYHLQQLQQGVTVGDDSRNSSSSNSNTNKTDSDSGGGSDNNNISRSGFSSGSSGKEIPTTSATATGTSGIGYSSCIMYDQHPSIADSYSLVVTPSAEANNTSTSDETTGKIDSDIEAQLS